MAAQTVPIPMHQGTLQQASGTDVAIIGAGIIGLFNALQYAKRGFGL